MLMYGFEALNSNVDGRYLEAIVWGYKLGLLTCADYNNLFLVWECDDINMHLGATDYGLHLTNEMYGVSSSLWFPVDLDDLFKWNLETLVQNMPPSNKFDFAIFGRK
jgi:hypothetical protein